MTGGGYEIDVNGVWVDVSVEAMLPYWLSVQEQEPEEKFKALPHEVLASLYPDVAEHGPFPEAQALFEEFIKKIVYRYQAYASFVEEGTELDRLSEKAAASIEAVLAPNPEDAAVEARLAQDVHRHSFLAGRISYMTPGVHPETFLRSAMRLVCPDLYVIHDGWLIKQQRTELVQTAIADIQVFTQSFHAEEARVAAEDAANAALYAEEDALA